MIKKEIMIFQTDVTRDAFMSSDYIVIMLS